MVRAVMLTCTAVNACTKSGFGNIESICDFNVVGLAGKSEYYCIPHIIQSLKVFDLVAKTGRGHGENDVLSEVFVLVVVDDFCLSSLNLVFHSLGHSMCENGDFGNQRIWFGRNGCTLNVPPQSLQP